MSTFVYAPSVVPIATETWPGHSGFRVYQVVAPGAPPQTLGHVVSLSTPPSWVVEAGWSPFREYWMVPSPLPAAFHLVPLPPTAGADWLTTNTPSTEGAPLRQFAVEATVTIPCEPVYEVRLRDEVPTGHPIVADAAIAWFTTDPAASTAAAWGSRAWPYSFLVVALGQYLLFEKTPTPPAEVVRPTVVVTASTPGASPRS